jgi:hypothetical protein
MQENCQPRAQAIKLKATVDLPLLDLINAASYTLSEENLD